MSRAVAYVDSSALVKLVMEEPGSTALRGYLHDHDLLASSRILSVEVRRALMRHSAPNHDFADEVLRSLLVVDLDASVATVAGRIGPPALRSLDAIHLASALELGEDLGAFVTYDERLAEAARALGMPVASPA